MRKRRGNEWDKKASVEYKHKRTVVRFSVLLQLQKIDNDDICSCHCSPGGAKESGTRDKKPGRTTGRQRTGRDVVVVIASPLEFVADTTRRLHF